MNVDDTDIQANLIYDQVMSVLGQTDFNSYGEKNESSFRYFEFELPIYYLSGASKKH